MAILNRDQALSRRLGQQRGGQGSLYGGPPPAPTPAPQMGPLTGSGMSTKDLLTRNWEGGQGGGGDTSIGGAIMGGLGTVLGGAAGALDFVSNAGTLAFEEISEGLMGKEFHTQMENGRLIDDRSNWDKLNDVEYGMGQLLGDVTGNKWIDRTIGFVGDVALDPLTYLGGAVAKSSLAMGKPGRIALAQKAKSLGMSDEVIEHIGKFAHVGLDDATRKSLGVKKAGLYWGVGDKSIRLPGTKTIGTSSEKAFSAVRRNTAGRMVGKVGKGRGRKELALARQVASTGKTVDDMTPARAAAMLNMVDEFASASAQAAEPWAREAQRTMSSWTDATRARVTAEVEDLNVGWDFETMGAAADPAKLANLSPEAKQYIALRDFIYSTVQKETGGGADLGFRGPGYMPHRTTKDAIEWLAADNDGLRLLDGSLHHGQDAGQRRSILPGSTHTIKGQEITFGNADVADINKVLTEAFPEAGVTKWVEDNSVALMERYIGEMSHITGTDKMIKRGIAEGTLGNLEAYSDDMVRTASNMTRNKELADALKQELARRQAKAENLAYEASKAGADLSQRLDDSLVRHLDEATQQHESLKGFRDDVSRELADHDGPGGQSLARISERFQVERARVAEVEEKLVAEVAELDANIAAANLKLQNLQDEGKAALQTKLDEWKAEHNRVSADLDATHKAGDDLNTADEMFGLTLAQAGRMDEIADSPQAIAELAQELEEIGLVTQKTPVFGDAVPADPHLRQAADEAVVELDELRATGVFDQSFDESLAKLEGTHPYRSQGDLELAVENNARAIDAAEDQVKDLAAKNEELRTASAEWRNSSPSAKPVKDGGPNGTRARPTVAARKKMNAQREMEKALNQTERQVATRQERLTRVEQHRELTRRIDNLMENAPSRSLGDLDGGPSVTTAEGWAQLEELETLRFEASAMLVQLEQDTSEILLEKMNRLPRSFDDTADDVGLRGRGTTVSRPEQRSKAAPGERGQGSRNEPGARNRLPRDVDSEGRAIVTEDLPPVSGYELTEREIQQEIAELSSKQRDLTKRIDDMDDEIRWANMSSQQKQYLKNEGGTPFGSPEGYTVPDNMATQYDEYLRSSSPASPLAQKRRAQMMRKQRQLVLERESGASGARGPSGGNVVAQRTGRRIPNADETDYTIVSRTETTDKWGFPSWDVHKGAPRMVNEKDMAANVQLLQRLDANAGETRRVIGWTETEVAPSRVAGKTREELETMQSQATERLDAATKVVEDGADVPSRGVADGRSTMEGMPSEAQVRMVTDLLANIDEGTRGARIDSNRAKNLAHKEHPTDRSSLNPEVRNSLEEQQAYRPNHSPNEERFAGPYDDWSDEAQKEFDKFDKLSRMHHSQSTMTRQQKMEWEAYPAAWRGRSPHSPQRTDVEGLIHDVDPEFAAGLGFIQREGGQEILAVREEARDALLEHQKVAKRIQEDTGITPELLDEVSPGGSFGNVLLYDSGYAARGGTAKWKENGYIQTERGLQQALSDQWGGDFKAFLRAHPHIKAEKFVGSPADGAVGHADAAAAMGGKSTVWKKGSANMQKHVTPELQRMAQEAAVRDAIMALDGPARTKLWLAARSDAGSRTADAQGVQRAARKELAEIEVALEGNKRISLRAQSASRRTKATGEKYSKEYEELELAQEAEQLREIEALYRMEAQHARLSDDFDRLAEVEVALGAREAEELAASDAVRASLQADWDVVDQHVEWAAERVATLKEWRSKSGALSKLVWDESKSPYTREMLDKRLDEFDHLLKLTMADLEPDPSLMAAARLYDDYFAQVRNLESFNSNTGRIDDLYQKALAGSKDIDEGFTLGGGLQRTLLDGWETLDTKLFPRHRDLAVDAALKKHLENFMTAINDDMDLKWFDEATQIFKSYATMTPGFHFRNYMGATFMNFSDGVTIGDTRRAQKHWAAYSADPDGYVKTLSEEEQAAFQAVFGVGAGGSFDAGELGVGLGRAAKGLKSNKAIRTSRRIGEDWVEGPVRLAAALNTTKNGGNVSDAMARVKRLHFDYSDLSGFDQKMKRVVPFWMFMSRNLPLQVEQMWRKPKAYAAYNSFMNNFDESDDDTMMPKYLKDAGAIVMGGSWFGDKTKDFVFAPDLQHNNLMQDIMAFTGEGEQGIPIVDGLLSSGNPLVAKPLEIAFNHSGFRGGEQFFDKEQDEYGNWEEKSFQKKALERLMYGAEGVFTPIGAAKGLTTIDPLGDEESSERLDDRQWQKALNYLGLTFKQLGDREREYERRRREREE